MPQKSTHFYPKLLDGSSSIATDVDTLVSALYQGRQEARVSRGKGLSIRRSVAIGAMSLVLASAVGLAVGQTSGSKSGGLKSGEYACFGSGGGP